MTYLATPFPLLLTVGRTLAATLVLEHDGFYELDSVYSDPDRVQIAVTATRHNVHVGIVSVDAGRNGLEYEGCSLVWRRPSIPFSILGEEVILLSSTTRLSRRCHAPA